MLATPELLDEAAQQIRLAGELSRCTREVPLYSSVLSAPVFYREQLQNWPLITKRDIRDGFPKNFLGPEVDLNELLEDELVELEHTSGTSEQRTPLLLPCGWWGEQELRALRLNSAVGEILRRNPDARRATINSPVCSGDIRYQGLPSRDDRIVGNALFVSLSRYPFLWSERDLGRIAEEILDWNPEFLDVDPVYGVVFALYCERQGIRLPRLRFVLCSYEFVSVVHRSILSRVFNVPILDLYGSTETGHLLMQDDAGQMRPSLKTAFFEVLHTDDKGIGDLVVTTLTNSFMPLIRYRIGDLVERSETPYGARYVLHGRAADAFTIGASQRVTTRQVDRCFAGISGIAHYQLVQRQLGEWLLKIVPSGAGPQAAQLQELNQQLSSLLKSSNVVKVEQTDMLGPESSGKFRLGYPANFQARAEVHRDAHLSSGVSAVVNHGCDGD
jgi:phenylacetate-CoA ligase